MFIKRRNAYLPPVSPELFGCTSPVFVVSDIGSFSVLLPAGVEGTSVSVLPLPYSWSPLSVSCEFLHDMAATIIKANKKGLNVAIVFIVMCFKEIKIIENPCRRFTGFQPLLT
jgi:hypothetical protein